MFFSFKLFCIFLVFFFIWLKNNGNCTGFCQKKACPNIVHTEMMIIKTYITKKILSKTCATWTHSCEILSFSSFSSLFSSNFWRWYFISFTWCSRDVISRTLPCECPLEVCSGSSDTDSSTFELDIPWSCLQSVCLVCLCFCCMSVFGLICAFLTQRTFATTSSMI